MFVKRMGQRAKQAFHPSRAVNYNIGRDWDDISLRFRRMFSGLGIVEVTEHLLEFRSQPPSVATGISLDREGRLLANMPLHSIDSSFTAIVFDEGLTSLQLRGSGVLYTYTVPSEILALRSRGV